MKGGADRIVLGFFLLAGLSLVPLSPETFTSGDPSVTYLQVRSLATGSLWDVELDLNDATARAPLDVFPLRSSGDHAYFREGGKAHNAFVHRAGDEWHADHPLAFAYLSLPGYLLFGEWGLLLVPLLAAGLCLRTTARWSGAVGLCPTRTVAVLAFGSPLLFYGTEFWGHVVAAASLTVALALLEGPGSPPVAGAGVAAGFAAVVRTDALLPGLLLIGYVVTRRWDRPLRSATLYLGTLALLVGVHSGVEGTLRQRFLGHLKVNVRVSKAPGEGDSAGIGARIRRMVALRAQTWWRNAGVIYGEHRGFATRINGALLLPLGALLILSLARERIGERAYEILYVLAAAAAALRLGVGLLVRPTLPVGLLVMTPALVLGLSPRRAFPHPGLRSLWLLVLVCVILVPAAGPTGGWQYGPRYLFHLMPAMSLLLVASGHLVDEKGRLRRAVVVLLVISFGMTLSALEDRVAKRALDTRQLSWVRTRPAGPVLLDAWFTGWNLAPLARERPMYYLPPRFFDDEGDDLEPGITWDSDHVLALLRHEAHREKMRSFLLEQGYDLVGEDVLDAGRGRTAIGLSFSRSSRTGGPP